MSDSIALGVRLNRQDAEATEDAIFMDGTPIAIRHDGMPDTEWHSFSRFVCGAPPRGLRSPVAFDLAVQRRLETVKYSIDETSLFKAAAGRTSRSLR